MSLVSCLRSPLRLAPTMARLMSGERFGHANGDSGWRWERNGIGMGGKDAGPGTEAKPETGKGENFAYNVPEFFKYDKYSYFTIEKDIVDAKARVEQPNSNLVLVKPGHRLVVWSV